MKKLLYLLLLPFIGMACMDDLGTYNYTTLNDIHIDTIREQTVEIYKTLDLPTNITCSQEGSELEYCWYRYTGNNLETDTLSREKDLHYTVSYPVGKYTIYFQVTDVATGLSNKLSFNLNVTGKFDQGLMVLGQVDGISNLIFINTANNVTEVYGQDNGLNLGSHPMVVVNSPNKNVVALTNLLVLSDDAGGGVSLNSADLSIASPLTDLFFIAPDDFHPQAYYKGVDFFEYGTRADFIISGGKLHLRKLGTAVEFGKTLLFNPVVPGSYELCNYAIVNGKSYLFYDNKYKRFQNVLDNWLEVESTFSSISSATSGFDPSDVGLTLVYMAEGYDKTGYGIFKDESNRLQLLTFSLGEYRNGASMSLLGKTNITSQAEGIADSKSYAMSLAKPFLFYTKGSKIYQYGLDNNTAFAIYDTDTVKINGKTVSTTIDRIYMEYVAYYYGYGSTADTYNTVLYVAASENGATGKKGSIHVLKLAANGTVESRTALFENVCGETVSMCYKR